MLIQALTETAQFGIKALIVTVSIAIVLILIFNLVSKLKGPGKDEFEVTSLNKKFEKSKKQLQKVLLCEKELKKQNKLDKKSAKAESESLSKRPKLWVLDFNGDIKASAAESLREEISCVLQVATQQDEVVLRLESPGGAVHGYGLAASQLQRLRQNDIPLTVCVDKVAASGGYMMACLGHRIVAAPFAIVGSIGVIAQVPNFHKFLKKNEIDFNEYTAGEFKRTVSLLAENTEKGVEKFKDQLEKTHVLFKNWIAENRGDLNLDEVATGEYWYGTQALALGLVDEISTSDQYLMQRLESHQMISVKKAPKKSLQEKLTDAMSLSLEKATDRFFSRRDLMV